MTIKEYLKQMKDVSESVPAMEKFVVPPQYFNNLIRMNEILLEACEQYVQMSGECMMLGHGSYCASRAISECEKLIGGEVNDH